MGISSTEQPVIIAQTGPLNGQRWAIGEVLLIGRDMGCQVIIADRQVSRFHARISRVEKGVLLEDLGSKNGTYVNGAPVSEPVYVQDSDLLQIAMVQQFVFLSSDVTMPLEMGSFLPKERHGRLFLDLRSRRVWIGQKEVIPPLSVPQFRLMQILYEQPDRVVPRQELVLAIWGEKEAVGISEQALDALIRRLRERLTSVDALHQYLVTVRGHGLRLDNPIE